MLVEFMRTRERQVGEGEDDGLGEVASQPTPISINPVHVAAVTESIRNDQATIIRLADGRGFSVRGSYAEVMEKLRANGADPAAD